MNPELRTSLISEHNGLSMRSAVLTPGRAPGFYVLSVCGESYLVGATSRMEAVNLLADSEGIPTDREDWTLLTDTMFAEFYLLDSPRPVSGNRQYYMSLCRHQSGYLGKIALIDGAGEAGGAYLAEAQ